MTILVGAIMIFGISQDRIACESFGYQSGRETKFIRLSFANYECMAASGNGKWIDIGSLRDIEE